MLTPEKTYSCEDCPTKGYFKSYAEARAAGWGIARGRKKCYCPVCALNHRRGKAKNANVPADGGDLPSGWEQLKIENF